LYIPEKDLEVFQEEEEFKYMKQAYAEEAEREK